jgi:hypothetical protein
MENQKYRLRIAKNVAILTVVFGGLSFYSFNCAPPAFQVKDEGGQLQLSSQSPEIVTGGTPLLDKKVEAPQALLTFEQIYESHMNLTGQRGNVSDPLLQEFSRRAGSFGVSPELLKVNSPMLLALTSFSGEVCNGLVQREQGLQADQRSYFGRVNFTTALNQLTNEGYLDSVSKMTSSFLGRAPSSEEIALFTTYRTEYMADLPTANAGQPAQTRNLILSTCAAILSTFDAYTY